MRPGSRTSNGVSTRPFRVRTRQCSASSWNVTHLLAWRRRLRLTGGSIRTRGVPARVKLAMIDAMRESDPMRAWNDEVDGLAYGGDYNPEQWPAETWAEDSRLPSSAV